MFRYLVTIGCVALLTACSNQVGIDGEIYVESNGKATKLALVDIQVIPEDVFKTHIKQQLPKADAEEKRLQESVNRLEESIASIRKAAGDVMVNTMAVAGMGGGSYGAMATSSNLMGQAADAVGSSQKTIDEMKAKIDGLKTGANSSFYYPTNLQGDIQKVASDADGKFKINIPKGKRSVLAAAKDDKYWFILLDPSNVKNPVALTNKNMNGTACNECVFTKTTTPASF